MAKKKASNPAMKPKGGMGGKGKVPKGGNMSSPNMITGFIKKK